MREMKDSGIEWIGEIRKDWDIKKLKYVTTIFRGGSPRPIEDYISNDEKGFNWIKIGDTVKGSKYITSTKCKIISEGLSKTRMVYKNDLVLTNSMSSGEPYILEIDGCIHDGWLAFSKYKSLTKEFLYYCLASDLCFLQFVEAVEGGIVQNLNISEVKNAVIFLPSEIEQKKIATYLDIQCSKIDTLIANQQSQIEKLKSYKQSLITEVVTKGLDKNVPMKDSGVEWIGEMPEHWKVTATKHLYKIESGATPKSDNNDYFDGDIVWITPADYKTEDVFVSKGKRTLTTEGLKSCSTTLIPIDSIIFSKRAPIGAVAINTVELCTNQGCLSCVSKTSDNIKYYYYVMSICTEQYNLLGSGTTFKEISASNFSNFILPLPSVKEQSEIVSFLDKKCLEVDKLISIKCQKIEKLQQYKKSLIYEYVTGKKEVK